MATNNRYTPVTPASNRYSPVAATTGEKVAYGKAISSPFGDIINPQYKAPTAVVKTPEVKVPVVAIAPQEGLLKKAAKAILPKQAEDFLGLNEKPANPLVTTAKTAIKNTARQIFTPYLPDETTMKAVEATANKVLLPVFNQPQVQTAMKEVAQKTSGTGIYSAIQATGPKTFQQAYEANKQAQAGDPSKWHQFLYQLGDTAPQTAIGVALNFVPYAGKPLSTTYWTSLSASEQIEKYGKVTNIGNIGIDVALDRMLGKSIESLFKASAETLTKTILKDFTVEGGTEVAQDLLKMANSYRVATSPAEKQQILQDAKDYFTSGQILMTAGVGGLTGAGIGAGAYGLNKTINTNQVVNENQAVPPSPPVPGGTPPPPPPPGAAGQGALALPEEQKNIVNIEKSRFNSGQELVDYIAKEGSGWGAPLNRTEIQQLVEHLQEGGKDSETISTWGGKNVRGTIYKAYGNQPGEYDIILGKVNSRGDSNSMVVGQIKNGKLDGRFRVHATPIEQKDIVGIIGSNELLSLGSGSNVSDNQPATPGPGYKKLVKYLDTAVKNKTFLPEDVTILKTLFEGTNDNLLETINFSDNGRLERALGRFKIQQNRYSGEINRSSNKLEMQKGMAGRGLIAADSEAAKIFAHEFGHAGWYLVLTSQERAMVTDIYNELTPTKRKAIFEGGLSAPNEGSNAAYYSKNEREFFAESFATYVLENKVPAEQMRPLLQRVAGKFFEGLKRLVYRGEVDAVNRMKPLFEKILNGDPSSPLVDFSLKEPPSFKLELQKMFETFGEPVQQPKGFVQQKPFFQGAAVPTKEVPVQSIFPSGTVQGTTISPMDEIEEIFGKATETLPPDIASTIEPPQAVVMGETNTPLNKRVKTSNLLQTPWRVLDKMGLRPAYQTLLKAYEAYVTELPTNIDKITAWSKRVPKESNERIFRFLDGEKITLNTTEAEVAGEIKVWLSQWADRLGMAPDARIAEYITHIFPKSSKGEMPEEIAAIINKKMAKSVYDPFLLSRQGAEGFIKDTWKALDAYTKRATRKVNMDPALEAFNEASKNLTDVTQIEYVNDFISRINMRPTTRDLNWDNEIKSLFGGLFGARPVNTITRFIRQMIARAKIGGSITSFAKNLTQGVNTFAELGTGYTLRGYLGLFRSGAYKEIKKNNVTMSPFIEDRTYSAVKKAAEIADRALFLNMEASENINRGAAYFGAKQKFIDGKVTPKAFREALGRDMPAGYEPTMEDAIEYGKFVAGKTQFRFDPLETPLLLSSDLARTAAQFQTFGLKQAEFILHMLHEREVAKLARYIASTVFVFGFMGSAFGMKWEDGFFPLRWGLPPALQFLVDLYGNVVTGKDKYGNKLSTKQRVGGVGKSLFTNMVPMGAQIQRSAEGFRTVAHGASDSPSGKLQYKVDQTPMNYIRGTLFGKYNLPEAKAYTAKQKGAKPKSTSGGSRYNPI